MIKPKIVYTYKTIRVFYLISFFQGDSAKRFVELSSAGLACHFHGGDSCGPTALYGWLFVILYIGFLFCVGKVLAYSGSMIYTLSVASLALPLSAFWWALFRAADKWGMEWYPQVSL